MYVCCLAESQRQTGPYLKELLYVSMVCMFFMLRIIIRESCHPGDVT